MQAFVAEGLDVDALLLLTLWQDALARAYR
jgi:hypothetical protein